MKKILSLIFISLIFASANIDCSFKEKAKEKIEKYAESVWYTFLNKHEKLKMFLYKVLHRPDSLSELEKFIEKEKPDLNWVNPKTNLTILMLAAVQPTEVAKNIVELLIEKGANPNIQNKNGWTALMYAADKGYKEKVKLLIDAHADLNKQDNNGNTALHLAAAKGYVEIIRDLLQAGAKVDVMDKNGGTALSVAAAKGNVEIAKKLIKANANINNQDKDGDTPLMNAVVFAKSETVRFLLNQGADPTIKNKRGETPLDIVETLPDVYSRWPIFKADKETKEEIKQIIKEKLKEPAKRKRRKTI